jgi:hypothetical protein
MTVKQIQKDALIGLDVLREAVREELEKKAKLGQEAVVCGRNGEPKVVSAKYLVRKMKSCKQGA